MEPAPELQVSRVSLASYARLLSGNRNFRRLWGAQVVSEIGDWFYTLAIYNLLLQLTGRAGSVALALILQVLPMTLIGPTAGIVNDRLRRKQVMIASDIGRMLIVLCMLLIRSKQRVWFVYPLLMAETLLVAFFEPARNAVIPNIVEREDVVVANTLASTTWSVNLMLGATLGGVVAALFGRDAVFLLNALSFVASAALIWGMRFAEPHAEGARRFDLRELVDFSPILAGIRYVRQHARLRATIFVKAGNLIVGPSLGAVHGHGTKRIRGPLARHGPRTRRLSRYESPARGPRIGRAPWPASGRFVGRTLEASIGTSDLLGILGRSRGLRFARSIRTSLAGKSVRHAGARRKFNRVGVLDDLVTDTKRRQVSWPRLRRRPRSLHVHHSRWGVSRRTLRGLGLRRAQRSHRRRRVDADSGSTLERVDAEGFYVRRSSIPD